MAMVLDAFVSEFVKMLVSYGNERIALILGVSQEIKKLHKNLALIQNVLVDAERRQLQDGATVGQWLDDLRDIMYDAEDIIEEYKAEAEKYKEEEPDSSSLGVPCCSPLKLFGKAKSKSDIAEKIKHLNSRLDDINKDKEAFHFDKTPVEDSKRRRISLNTSILEEPDIMGSAIEGATRDMVGLLTQENSSKNILIYAIVGMGGIGKTTLAQKICNDDILLTTFHPLKPIWVCISKDNVDEIKILKSIICSLGGASSNVNERGQLEEMLNEVVRGKRLFLVLDDIWDVQVWENLLRKPLCSAGTGSKVLLTTRDERIAMQMRAEHRHIVAKLSDEDGWSLLCKKVFKDGEEEEMHALKEIGIQIVKKCDGLPVAIKAVAGVLQTKELTYSEWNRVLLDPSWSSTSVEQVFKVSYEDLPSHLKQCFLYFALFPEDSYLRRDEITHMWIAEGFVKTKDNKMLEETANDYWKELIQRNLLQVIDHTILTCKMHDLLLKFAQDLVKGECFCADVKALNEIVLRTQKKARRWYVRGAELDFRAINEHTSFRTFFMNCGEVNATNEEFTLLKRTRILILHFRNLERLPSSFVDLQYLRHLDLSYSSIIELPESIKSFKNLQFLSLFYCHNLRSLPNDIGFLTNLRYLNVRYTKVNQMPKRMVKLGQLRTILGFQISGSSSDGDTWCTLEDVKHFKELKDLELYNLEKTSGAAEARAVALEEKNLLTRLTLSFCKLKSKFYERPDEVKFDEEMSNRITEMLEELHPPACIEELNVSRCDVRTFPSWLMRPSSMANLRILEVAFGPRCEELPPLLKQLPQLAKLHFINLGLRRVGLDFFLSNSRDTSQCSFPKLEMLCFHRLKNWEDWEDLPEENEDNNLLQEKIAPLPRLKKLKIDYCDKLRYLPHLLLNHATALRELSIYSADKLEVVENLHHIKTLDISYCSNLKRVANLSSLKILNINFLPDMEDLPELQLLTIYGTSMESLPVTTHLPKLHKLSIHYGKVSLLLRCRMSGEEWPKIRHIPHFEFRTDYGLFINYTKSPVSYDTNFNSIESKDESLPERVNNSSLHQHPLILLPCIHYWCNKCHEHGEGWSFRCEDCVRYDFHPNCALQESEENNYSSGEEAAGRGCLCYPRAT